MHIIPIQVSGKVALCPKRYLISSNCDYVLRFSFDSAWDDVPVKTARVLFGDQCLDLPFTGTDAALPRIPVCGSIAVGVFSDSLATTAASLGCIVSVADSDAEAWNALTETQYNALFAILNALENRALSSLALSGDTLTLQFSDGSTQTVSLAPLRGTALLPAPGTNDEGKLAAVENGVWAARTPPDHDALIAAWMDAHFSAYCLQAGVGAPPAEGVGF